MDLRILLNTLVPLSILIITYFLLNEWKETKRLKIRRMIRRNRRSRRYRTVSGGKRYAKNL